MKIEYILKIDGTDEKKIKKVLDLMDKLRVYLDKINIEYVLTEEKQ